MSYELFEKINCKNIQKKELFDNNVRNFNYKNVMFPDNKSYLIGGRLSFK